LPFNRTLLTEPVFTAIIPPVKPKLKGKLRRRNGEFRIHLEKLSLMTTEKKVPTSSSPKSLDLEDCMLNLVERLVTSPRNCCF
jgi:hypothetical protein